MAPGLPLPYIWDPPSEHQKIDPENPKIAQGELALEGEGHIFPNIATLLGRFLSISLLQNGENMLKSNFFRYPCTDIWSCAEV